MSLFEDSGVQPGAVAVDSPYQAPFDGSLALVDLPTRAPRTGVGNRAKLRKVRDQLGNVQEALYAGRQYSVLCIFQALDAAGKDGTIREVFQGLDPSGVKVASFKRPSARELAHDFLWRTSRELPGRGRIGVFNRSYYEEVLVVRVHPEFLAAQYPMGSPEPEGLWPMRYRAIREHERHLAAASTVILKFWLNVSPEEQARRFLDRIEESDKRWKFSARDVYEAGHRAEYDAAALDMLNETSRPWAPWFVIPADDKPFMRLQVARIVLHALQALPLEYPRPDVADSAEMDGIADRLRDQLKSGN
ncbi:MAG: polyphosphate kinase 2 family protein [Xanthomonadales bacterium]|nr:polyphosphate kinase 2 family protein [Xanthomonadales bacterium]NIX14103.1 polyphosphate kinase 2 family protein [Xanthomonadales bacterium]